MGTMGRIRYFRKKRRGSNDKFIIRVSPNFKSLVDEMKREMANVMKVPVEKITTPLVTERIARTIKSKKKNLNEKISDFLDELTGIK